MKRVKFDLQKSRETFRPKKRLSWVGERSGCWVKTDTKFCTKGPALQKTGGMDGLRRESYCDYCSNISNVCYVFDVSSVLENMWTFAAVNISILKRAYYQKNILTNNRNKLLSLKSEITNTNKV